MSDINLSKLYNNGYDPVTQERVSRVKGSYIPIDQYTDYDKHALFCDLFEEVQDKYTNIISNIDTFISKDNTNFTIPAELNIKNKDIEYSYDDYKSIHDNIIGTQFEANYSSDIQNAILFETYHSGYATDSNLLIPLRADLSVISRCLDTYSEWKDVPNPNVLQPIYNNTYWKERQSGYYDDLSNSIQISITNRIGGGSIGGVSSGGGASMPYVSGLPDDINGERPNRRIGNAGDTYQQIEDKIRDVRLKKALQWLMDNNLPINTVRDLVTSKMQYYNGLLINTISQRANVASYYLTYVPNTIARYMHEAQNYIMRPFYEYVQKLPPMPGEVDELLDKLLDEADRTVNIGTQYALDALKLSRIEEEICNKRLEFMREVNEFYNINSVLESVRNSTKII